MGGERKNSDQFHSGRGRKPFEDQSDVKEVTTIRLPKWLKDQLKSKGNASRIIETALKSFGLVKGRTLSAEQRILIALADETDEEIMCDECQEEFGRDKIICIVSPEYTEFICPDCYDDVFDYHQDKGHHVFYLANYHEIVSINLTKEMADAMKDLYVDPADCIKEILREYDYHYYRRRDV